MDACVEPGLVALSFSPSGANGMFSRVRLKGLSSSRAPFEAVSARLLARRSRRTLSGAKINDH